MALNHRLIFVFLALGMGCGPDTGGLSTSGDGSDSGSSGTEGSTSNSGTTTATTASTVATSDADGTTTSTPDTTTGPMDTTAEGSSGEPPGTDSSSSGEPPGAAYPACEAGDMPCPEPYTFCVSPGDFGNWCSFECMDATECPEPDTGSAEVICGGPPMQPTRCELDCSNGDCPDGMDCVGLGPMGQAERCVWPAA